MRMFLFWLAVLGPLDIRRESTTLQIHPDGISDTPESWSKEMSSALRRPLTRSLRALDNIAIRARNSGPSNSPALMSASLHPSGVKK